MVARRLMGIVRAHATDALARANGSGHARIASVTSTLERPELVDAPERFLARAPGLARGFWQHDGSWSAQVGVAARIEVGPDEVPMNGTAGDRFELVRHRAADLLEDAVCERDDGRARPPRLHGGFAFHAHHQATDRWDAFPTARFVVPALELVGGPRGLQLTATVHAPGSRRETLARARKAFERALDALERDAPSPPTEVDMPHVVDQTDRSRWDKGTERILHGVSTGDVEKAVLARTLDVRAGARFDPVAVLANLRRENPGTHLFYMEPNPGSVLVGAAPELVGRVRGHVLHASAVAGSIRRGRDEAEDDELSRRLLTSEKDRAEHAFVVDDMRERLSRLADGVEVGSDAHILRLNRIQHLETDLYAKLPDDVHILELVRALHPTPAVCGHPREAAAALLHEIEAFDRGWYAGPVGWFDGAGDGEFAPALRSAVLHDDVWRLFAGAGIVDGSDPAREWDETRIKLEPVLRALGIGWAP